LRKRLHGGNFRVFIAILSPAGPSTRFRLSQDCAVHEAVSMAWPAQPLPPRWPWRKASPTAGAIWGGPRPHCQVENRRDGN
jgi:hypothetical protein